MMIDFEKTTFEEFQKQGVWGRSPPTMEPHLGQSGAVFIEKEGREERGWRGRRKQRDQRTKMMQAKIDNTATQLLLYWQRECRRRAVWVSCKLESFAAGNEAPSEAI
jgi:hypothetical protein